MKKHTITLFLLATLCSQAQEFSFSPKDTGSVKFTIINPVDKEGHALLSGILYIENQKEIRVTTNMDGEYRIKKMHAGKYNFKFKTNTCCLYELTGVLIFKDKTTYLNWNLPLKKDKNDTCVIRQKYELPKIDKDVPSRCKVN